MYSVMRQRQSSGYLFREAVMIPQNSINLKSYVPGTRASDTTILGSVPNTKASTAIKIKN